MTDEPADPNLRQQLSELVERQLDFVYSAALRQVHDPHVAEDVTQAVFILLWKKCADIEAGIVLEGWLYEATRYAAKSAMRSQRRREFHERAAGKLDNVQHEEAAWEQMAPLLDEAMAKLGKADRDAVLLRFFRQKSYEEVARCTGATEAATRKRVSRAVEKLRTFFARRGVRTSGDMLGSAIGWGAIQAAPRGLAGKAISVAASGSSVNVGLAKAVATMMNWGRAKAAGMIVGALVVAGSGAATIYALARQPAALANASPPAISPAPTTALAVAHDDRPFWRKRFDEVYFLNDKQLVKFVPEPFIAERYDYYREAEAFQWKLVKQAPSYFTFTWDGKLERFGLGFVGRNLTLRMVLANSFQLASYEIEGPAELLNIPMPRGDWILRKDVPFEKMVPELLAIVQKATGRTVTFERRTVKRTPAIVARGQFQFHPLAGQTAVVMYSGVMDENSGAGGGSGDLQRFLETLGSRAHCQVINLAQGEANANFAWLTHRSAYIEPEEKNREDKIRALLDNLQKQTDLLFTIEPRDVQVWSIKDNAGL